MSNLNKIEKELRELLETEPKRNEDRQDFLFRLLSGIDKLSDKAFNSLSSDATDWFNKACDAAEAKKDLPDFPEEKAEGASRRRASSSDEKDKSSKSSKSEPEVGDVVKVTTKRGKVVEGKLVESDDEAVVVKTGEGDEELMRSRIESIEVVGGGDAGGNDEPEDPVKVGAVVEATTKRGKVIKGKIVEMDDEVIVIQTDDGDEELQRSRVESITVGKSDKKDEKSETPSRRTSTADKKDEKSTKPATTRGPSATSQIRELIIEHLKSKGSLISKDALGKAVEKAGIEAKTATVDLVLSETGKIIEMLDDAELLADALKK